MLSSPLYIAYDQGWVNDPVSNCTQHDVSSSPWKVRNSGDNIKLKDRPVTRRCFIAYIGIGFWDFKLSEGSRLQSLIKKFMFGILITLQ